MLKRKIIKEIVLSTNDINLESQNKTKNNLLSVQSLQLNFSHRNNKIDESKLKVEIKKLQPKNSKSPKKYKINSQITQYGGFKNFSLPSSPVKNQFQNEIIQENLSQIITQSMLKTIKVNNFQKNEDLNQIIYTLNKSSKIMKDIIFLNEKINNQQNFFEYVSIQDKNVQYFYDSILYEFIPKGKPLYELGHTADCMFLLLEGEAYYLIKSFGNIWNQLKDAVILGKYLDLNIAKTVRKYDFIGDYDLLKKQRRQGTCVAKTDCHVVRISKSVFDSLTKKRLEQYYYFMNKLLINSRVFIEIKKRQLFNIMSCFSFKEYQKEQIIYNQFQNDNQVYILVTGQVQLKSIKEHMEESFEQSQETKLIINGQQYFGEETIFELQKQHTATCISQKALVIKIEKTKLQDLITENVLIFHQRIKYFSAINRSFTPQINEERENKVDENEFTQDISKFNTIDLDQIKRPSSSIDQNILSSARSNYSSNRFMRNLRNISQCQVRDQLNTCRDSQFEDNKNNQNSVFEYSWMKTKLSMESLNTKKHNEELKFSQIKNQHSLSSQRDQKIEGNNNNSRRFRYQIEDLNEFDDKEIKENFEHSSLFQMYQMKKKELFQRANNFRIQENLSDFSNKFDFKQSNSIEISLKHKIQQFQSLFGHSPQKNQILLKQKNSYKQNFEQNHKKKFLSLSVDETQNNDCNLSLQPLKQIQSIEANQLKLNANSLNTNSNFQNNNNNLLSNKSRQTYIKKPIYCTIYKEKLLNTNNHRYFRNVKLDFQNQPQLSYSILSKICK
ncbi:hypothetical protein ABPG72_000383 [Tetrahymena utriculariae]